MCEPQRFRLWRITSTLQGWVCVFLCFVCQAATFCGDGFAAYFAGNCCLSNVFLTKPKSLPDEGSSAPSSSEPSTKLLLPFLRSPQTFPCSPHNQNHTLEQDSGLDHRYRLCSRQKVAASMPRCLDWHAVTFEHTNRNVSPSMFWMGGRVSVTYACEVFFFFFWCLREGNTKVRVKPEA